MANADIILYPFDQVFAIIDEQEATDQALAELANGGVPDDDMVVLTGEAGAARIDAAGTKHGMVARLWRTLQFMTMDALPDAERYEQAAEAGNFVVAIRAGDGQRRELTRQVLKQHGAHFINYYGKLTTVPLD